MQADELLLFIQYDSVEGTPRFVFHAAIDNEADISVLKTVKVKLKNGPDFLTYYFHEGNIGGMLVPGRADLRLGDKVNIELYTLAENQVFNIRGQVKWRRLRDEEKLRAGAGVEFLDSERKARDILLEFANGRDISIHRRKSARLPAIIEVDYASGSVFLTDVTDNVSKGGAFILTRTPPPKGTILKVRLRPPGYRHGVTIDAEVIWRRENPSPGVGVRFVFPWYRSARKLYRLIEQIKHQIGLSNH